MNISIDPEHFPVQIPRGPQDQDTAKPVLPEDNQYLAKVNNIDFTKLKWKLTQSSESSWTESLCDFAEQEYRKFLALKLEFPKVSVVPNKLVDKFWHEHILDTKSYAEDCQKTFGYFLHHYPYFGIHDEKDQENLQSSFDLTVQLYESRYGKYPVEDVFSNKVPQLARCTDHACHVPSSCACRTPGACK